MSGLRTTCNEAVCAATDVNVAVEARMVSHVDAPIQGSLNVRHKDLEKEGEVTLETRAVACMHHALFLLYSFIVSDVADV